MAPWHMGAGIGSCHIGLAAGMANPYCIAQVGLIYNNYMAFMALAHIAFPLCALARRRFACVFFPDRILSGYFLVLDKPAALCGTGFCTP